MSNSYPWSGCRWPPWSHLANFRRHGAQRYRSSLATASAQKNGIRPHTLCRIWHIWIRFSKCFTTSLAKMLFDLRNRLHRRNTHKSATRPKPRAVGVDLGQTARALSKQSFWPIEPCHSNIHSPQFGTPRTKNMTNVHRGRGESVPVSLRVGPTCQKSWLQKKN